GGPQRLPAGQPRSGAESVNRFCALDALRGICALLVVIFHIEVIGKIYAGSFHAVPFFENAFLFVDFFFVLSGFIITHGYFTKISNKEELGSFLIRRFGRVYPLHFLFLMAFVCLELWSFARGLRTGNNPFHESYSVPSLFTNIFLIQAMHI